MDNEERNSYIIPVNYKSPGKWRGIPIINAIEGVVAGILAAMIIMAIPFTWQFKFILVCSSFLLLMVLFIRGINGEHVPGFLMACWTYFSHLIRKRCVYKMRKVGIEDVKTLKNRDSGYKEGQTNLDRILSSFKGKKKEKQG